MTGLVGEMSVEGIVAERLRAGRAVSMRVWGHSMLPMVLPGARLRFEACKAADVRVGDVLLVDRGERHLVAHRVVAIGPAGIELRGDALERLDEPVLAEQVLGRATGVPLLGRQLPVPAPIAGPLNRGLGRLAPALTAARAMLRAPARDLWRVAHPLLRGARMRLQPFELVAFDASRADLVPQLVLRARRRVSSEVAAQWRSAAQSGGGAAWLAMHEMLPVGWMLAVQRHDGHELSLWVARSFRGLGVASGLLDRMLVTASERRWARLCIETPRATARWLEQRGFTTRDRGGHTVRLERVIEPR